MLQFRLDEFKRDRSADVAVGKAIEFALLQINSLAQAHAVKKKTGRRVTIEFDRQKLAMILTKRFQDFYRFRTVDRHFGIDAVGEPEIKQLF